MFQREVLVVKFLAVDRLPASALKSGEFLIKLQRAS